jgi:hypothetical protein
LPTPRGLSQAPTSFIGSWYQDIHRLPLVACHKTNNKRQNYATKRCSRPLYSSQNTGRNTSPHPPHTWSRTPSRETTHPSSEPTSSLVRAGPSHPPHQHNVSVTVTQKNQSTSPTRPGPIPQDPTARLSLSLNPHSRSTLPLRRESAVLASPGRDPSLMVNVPHSEAPSPQDIRLRNDE